MNSSGDPDWAAQFTFTKRFWLGCAILFMSAVFATVTVISAGDARRLARHNIEIPATVLDHRFIAQNSARDGKGTHFITYSFTWNNQTIANERAVPQNFHNSHPVGHSWMIRIHPDAPRIHDLYDGQTRTTAWGHLAISLLMGLFGLFFGLSNGNLAALRARMRSTAP
ncbi:DUF3592 domain-containing protein [Octadecabacter sp. G9-8]|uniref:DUF3592 domain-containing protein n=1 Tax=Octadecabacter dasysiphoniae TaxID=2909341 RepID=A0ABS9CZY0_9RHOB|nr:DUF3592 domain-containing protein [Octadecabacter dasysiphoniae]MCF2872813.1 DUF3592 domain-containing protein [Octadecabacter dasysiphoniae]